MIQYNNWFDYFAQSMLLALTIQLTEIMNKPTLILGASNNPGRYAYLAQQRLTQAGHPVFPVNPRENEVGGVASYPSIDAIDQAIDTVTVYVNAERLTPMLTALLALKPKRVIFNPGSEAPIVQTALDEAGIETLDACTLVLLSTGQY